MTISDRINLHRCGYSKEEINALIAEEKAAPADPEPASDPDPAPAPAAPAQPQNTEILDAIKNLTAAIQAQNLQRAAQDPASPVTPEDVLTGALKNL